MDFFFLSYAFLVIFLHAGKLVFFFFDYIIRYFFIFIKISSDNTLIRGPCTHTNRKWHICDYRFSEVVPWTRQTIRLNLYGCSETFHLYTYERIGRRKTLFWKNYIVFNIKMWSTFHDSNHKVFFFQDKWNNIFLYSVFNSMFKKRNVKKIYITENLKNDITSMDIFT
jgi:hypothetical protein